MRCDFDVGDFARRSKSALTESSVFASIMSFSNSQQIGLPDLLFSSSRIVIR